MTTRGWRRSCGAALAVLLVLQGLAASVPSEAATINYAYDDLGRLVGVLDPAGGTAVYRYDAVGNLLSIARFATTELSVIDFTPRRGPVGASVTITGTGFSATPAQNLVTFNGTPAAVASSSATQIVATVPVGATTGPIGVTVGLASASSGTAFTVTTAASGLPTITGFTPAVGVIGAAVTVTGTNFELLPVDDIVTFNGLQRATVTGAAATTLTTLVPTGVGSGRISVETPAGKAVSADDFFVAPAPYSAATVQATGRLPRDGTLTVTISSAGKIALVVFDATAGQRVTLNMTSVSMGSASVGVYNPAGASFAGVSVNGNGGRLNLTLDAAGTYTVLVAPTSPNTGSMTLGLATADMVPVALTAPASVTTQQAVPVTWTVKNQGTAATGNLWADAVYLSANQTCCSGASLLGTWNLATPVPAGGSYTMTRTVTIPKVAGGSYYLFIQTDTSGIVYEADEGNNTLASPITVTTPDLTPTVFTTPASAGAQQATSVTWTVKNQGTGPTGSLWADAVYLSTNQTCCSGASLLGTWNLATPVPAGGTYTMTRTVTIPKVVGGSYYLFIQTDTSGLVYEADEGNNTLASPITVTTPDLTPTVFTTPASAGAQQAISVTWTVKNQGTGPTGSLWADAVYLSANQTCCSGASLLGTWNLGTPVPAGGTYTMTRTVTIPKVVGGSYYLFIQTDISGLIYEADEGNNTLVSPITVTTPDLTPTVFTTPASAGAQQAVSVTWTVKNQGTGPTGSLWADAVYFSTNPTCCSAATLLTAWNLATPVPAGGAYTMTRTVTIPSVAAGSYYLIVRTDISGLIYEADEGNNTLARPITVTGPGPDLVPTAVTAPASVSTQEADPVSWTVKNQGTASASGAWTDTLYLSPSSTCCVSATSLASVSVSPGTPAGASYTQTQTVTIPNVAAGGYYLIISTDAGNTRAETDEGNNQLAVALAVTTPDLMPTALTAPPRGDSPAGGVRVLDGEEPRDGPRRLTVDGYALHLPELELLCERDQSQVGESGAGHGGGRDLYPDADGDDSEPARRGVRPVHQGRRERHALRGGRDEQ